MQIGDTVTVTYEQSKQLRKEGWKPRNDVVVMMYVGMPEEPKWPIRRPKLPPELLCQSRQAINSRNFRARKAAEWTEKQHAFVARKLAEAAR